jgi:hypothetical protein
MRDRRSTDQPDLAGDAEETVAAPIDRGYLTDGETLFHIERTLVNDPRGELLVELEDCGTLELIVCSARSVAELGLRPVKPLAPAPA